ncbi:MAG: fused MFS/spermidine synthase [Anaerolineae bacterium]|nr:fused MFS/spermidine synthase [Anaerolineae bacterium]
MTATQPAQWQNSWFWRPNLLVFLSSACIMTLELAVGRITAPYVGVSLYTWTIVIGVVLAGISLGNYVGGWLADRWTSPRLLGRIYILGGLFSLSILAVDVLNTFYDLERITPDNLSFIAILALFVIVLCFLPCVILGTISPIVVKLAVHDLDKTGRTIGRIYAAGAAGSILGTFTTGFFLISWLGTRTVIWSIGMVLLLIGILLLLRRRWFGLLLSILIVGGGSAAAVNLGWLNGPCLRETNYYCIRVHEDELDGEQVRKLVLDRLLHSYTYVDNPTKLVYGYEKLYAEATTYQAQRKEHLSTLFIGGGGYTFPRYVEALYPESDIHVIEIDPGVTEVAHDMLGLNRDTRVRTFNEDARMFLGREPTTSYNLIYGDAFNDYTVPYHLTTREFNERVHAWLAEDGLYMVNLIDGPYGNFMRSYAHTLRQTFRYVYMALNVDNWRRSPRSTIVFIATDTPLDMEMLQSIETGEDSPRLADLVLTEDTFDALLAEGRAITLSDSFAPTDLMLLPVFLDQVPDQEE